MAHTFRMEWRPGYVPSLLDIQIAIADRRGYCPDGCLLGPDNINDDGSMRCWHTLPGPDPDRAYDEARERRL